MHSTEGIILKKIDIGEADGLLVIFTKDFGKIRAYAQGVKKESAKLKGHLEILNHSSLQFVLGKSGERLTHASLINFWPEIRQHSEKLHAAWSIKELVDANCMPGEKDEGLWNLLISSFEALERHSFYRGETDLLRDAFEKKFLEHAGYGTLKKSLILKF